MKTTLAFKYIIEINGVWYITLRITDMVNEHQIHIAYAAYVQETVLTAK